MITTGGYYGMQTFDQALFGHVKAGRVTFEDAMRVASSPHDFKLLMQADGRRGTTMEDVAAAEANRDAESKPSLSRRLTGRPRTTSVGKVTVEMAVDETCPVCMTAEIVCGKWTLLLVRDLAEGRSRFCELERSLAGISPRTLSLRLRALEEEGIVERHTFPEVPPRVEYALTEKGRALLPIIDDMRAYGERLARRGVRRAAPPIEDRPSRSWPSRSSPSQLADRCKTGCAGQERGRASANSAHHAFTPASGGADGVRRGGRQPPARRGRRRRRGPVRARAADGRAGDRAARRCTATGRSPASSSPSARRSSSACPATPRLARLLEGFDGLDRYLASMGADPARADARTRARAAIRALLRDVFEEQTDFELRPERLRAALERLERSALAGSGETTLVATLHGLTISSAELAADAGA